jgi:uncharacterized protein (TIGR02453 family)
MTYFRPAYLQFFQELALNNHREWFHANKKTYEKEVKEPFKAFVQALIDEAGKVEPDIIIDPKDAIFRINRDIRFSKDKSPYKLYNSAVISANGKKEKSKPGGFYVELSADYLRIYQGAYMVGKEDLQRLREHLAAHAEEFAALISEKDFVDTYGAIRGDKHKRIPKELKEAAEQQPLIYNKQFYYFAELPPETILEEELVSIVMDTYRKGKPLADFLAKGF